MQAFHIPGAAPLYTNTFLLISDAGHAVVIDPAADAQTYDKILKENNAQLTTILCTHGHYDHVGSAEALRTEWNAKLYCEAADLAGDRMYPLSAADCGYAEGETVSVAAQGIGGIGKTGCSGCSPQLVGVFLPQLFQQLCAGGIRHAQRVEQAEQVAHVAHFQHPLGPQRIQRPRRQTHRLLHLCFAHRTQHLKAHLADFFKGVALGGRAVDVLVIVV